MDKREINKKLVAALDDTVKGAAALLVTAIVTRFIDSAYDKYIVARRTPPAIEGPTTDA